MKMTESVFTLVQYNRPTCPLILKAYTSFILLNPWLTFGLTHKYSKTSISDHSEKRPTTLERPIELLPIDFSIEPIHF